MRLITLYQNKRKTYLLENNNSNNNEFQLSFLVIIVACDILVATYNGFSYQFIFKSIDYVLGSIILKLSIYTWINSLYIMHGIMLKFLIFKCRFWNKLKDL